MQMKLGSSINLVDMELGMVAKSLNLLIVKYIIHKDKEQRGGIMSKKNSTLFMDDL